MKKKGRTDRPLLGNSLVLWRTYGYGSTHKWIENLVLCPIIFKKIIVLILKIKTNFGLVLINLDQNWQLIVGWPRLVNPQFFLSKISNLVLNIIELKNELKKIQVLIIMPIKFNLIPIWFLLIKIENKDFY
jgi:hypothetical protein